MLEIWSALQWAPHLFSPKAGTFYFDYSVPHCTAQYQRKTLKHALKILRCPPFTKGRTTVNTAFRVNNIWEQTQQLYQHGLAPAVMIIIFILLILQLKIAELNSTYFILWLFFSYLNCIYNFRCSTTVEADRYYLSSTNFALKKR